MSSSIVSRLWDDALRSAGKLWKVLVLESQDSIGYVYSRSVASRDEIAATKIYRVARCIINAIG